MYSHIVTLHVPSNNHIKRSHIGQTCTVTQSHETYKQTVRAHSELVLLKHLCDVKY